MPARHDNVTDPELAAALLLARRGQAYFSRALGNLRDNEFDRPTRLAGWDRRHLIAHVGLNARALTRLTEWALTGVETPMYASNTQRDEEIDFASTLPVQALRNLSDHAAVHLTVEWRDLPTDAWSARVRTAQGRDVPVSETVWMRTREVWIHAVDLDSGASFVDIPAAVIDRLLTDVGGAWDRRRAAEGLPVIGFVATDRSPVEHPESEFTVRGPAARLAQWATGRGAVDVELVRGGSVPAPPRWL
jgi:maleylpyruvate isomerase